MRKLLILLTILCSASAFAQLRTTTGPGDYLDPTIWDCTCIPTTTASVVINHAVTTSANIQNNNFKVGATGSFVSTATLQLTGDLQIDNGGLLENAVYLFVDGNYINYGTHNSGNYTLLDGPGSQIGGNGTINLGSWFIVRNGDKTIQSSADLDLVGGFGFYMWTGTGDVFNNGKMGMNYLGGVAGTQWIQQSGSVIAINNEFFGGVPVDASALNNEVIYDGTAQPIHSTVGDVYYDLTLKSIAITNQKTLAADVTILNDLTIENCRYSANNLDTYVGGDWINTSGNFTGGTGTVFFNGDDQSIFEGSDIEQFYNVTISGTGTLTLDSRIDVFGSLVNSKTFDSKGKRIRVRGDWTNSGTYVPGTGNVVFYSSGSSLINGNTEFYTLRLRKGTSVTNTGSINVTRNLQVQSGIFNTGDDVTLISTSSYTARLSTITGGGSVSGDMTVQRYLNTANNNWHLLGSPVQGTTLTDWNDDILTTGFTGADYPTFYFNNATYYDETYAGDKDTGLLDATNITDAISPGMGWRMYLPIDAVTIDVTGPISQGLTDIPLTYTNTGSVLDDGWNLVANPFPSAVNWDDVDWTKTNVNDAIYVWNPNNSQYTTYVAGAGTNGGSRFIPSTQAFWVQTNAGSPILRVNEGAKTGNNTAIRHAESFKKDFFSIEIRAVASNLKDELIIRLNESTTDGYDPTLDAYELRSPYPEVPAISVIGELGSHYSIQSTSLQGEDKVIPLNISVGVDGIYDFTFSNISHFSDLTCLSLFDADTETYYDLSDQETLSFDLVAAEEINRFSLKICPSLSEYNMTSKEDLEEDEVLVYKKENYIVIDLGDIEPGDYNIAIYDLLGRTIIERDFHKVENGKILMPESDIVGHVLIAIRNLDTGKSNVKKLYIGSD